MKPLVAFAAALALTACATPPAPEPRGAADIVFRGGTIYDGSGGEPYIGDVAVSGDRIIYVGPRTLGRGRIEVDATGKAVAPGFINMLSWANESLLADGRGLSDLVQGVTLEVMGEGSSMGPWNPDMKRLEAERQGEIKYPITWTTLDEYLTHLERRGIAPNVASFVGAETVRTHVLGEGDVDPTPAQLTTMKGLVRAAMEDGAMGVGSSLIYAPGTFAETDELVALTTEAGRCGGMYISHMRNESDGLLRSIDEVIEISRRSGAPAEIYHLKAAGKPNWPLLEQAIARIEAARASGLRITADMYTYPAASTGLDAAMPPWVQAGGREAWIGRLKDPATRARVLAEMRDPAPTWENTLQDAGPEGAMVVGLQNPQLKPLIGKTLAAIARERGVSPEDAAIDLVIEDGTRVQMVYFLMSEDNVRRQTTLPWVSFGSDGAALAPEGVFIKNATHPRAYGNFARLLGKYVREERALTLAEAVRKMTSLPAANLGLRDRGSLREGLFADVVVFDPATIRDNAVYDKPHQLATGVSHVLVNGRLALRDGLPTGASTGRVVRGKGWRGWPTAAAAPPPPPGTPPDEHARAAPAGAPAQPLRPKAQNRACREKPALHGAHARRHGQRPVHLRLRQLPAGGARPLRRRPAAVRQHDHPGVHRGPLARAAAPTRRPLGPRPRSHRRGGLRHPLRGDHLGLVGDQELPPGRGRAGRRHAGPRHEQLGRLNAWFAGELGEGPWFGGQTFGWADACAAPFVQGAASFGVGPAGGSPLHGWLLRCRERPSVAAAFEAARASLAAMARVAEVVERGQFKRQYRDHRLEWMIRSGGYDIVGRGLDRDNIRFTEEPRP
jgi:N-acyl-D-amino-acid deacylase